MAEFITYKTLIEFITANQNYIEDNFFAHFNLIKVIQSHPKEGCKIVNAFNIVDQDNSFVLCLVLDGRMVLYSTKWNNDIIKELSEKITFDGVSFSGQKHFILDLFKHNNIDFEIFKDRIVYDCDKVTDNIKLSSGRFCLAEADDLDKISELTHNYHLEEYKEHAFRDYDNIKNSTKNNIDSEIIFKWVDNGEITSIAQVVSHQCNLPIIGAFYTDKKKRGNGYGSSLLFSLTNYLLSNGYEKCGLVSDATNQTTNKIFKAIGYTNIYETISVHKKK
jgi:RimJ/RimL family protein N-acetyltransferase